jgi:hypothetical protein
LWQRLSNLLQGGAFPQYAFPKDMYIMTSSPVSELSYSRVMPHHGSHHPSYLSAVDMLFGTAIPPKVPSTMPGGGRRCGMKASSVYPVKRVGKLVSLRDACS